METTDGEAAAARANDFYLGTNDVPITDVVALCDSSFKEAIKHLEKNQRKRQYSRSKNFSRMNEQPVYRRRFRLIVNLLNSALVSVTKENAELYGSEADKIKQCLNTINWGIRALNQLVSKIRFSARSRLQQKVDLFMRSNLDSHDGQFRFHMKSRDAITAIYNIQSRNWSRLLLFYWKHEWESWRVYSAQPTTGLQQNKQSAEDNASTFINFDESVTSFPSPPQFEDGEDEKPCPLCRRMFPKAKFNNVLWWRFHVNNDLLPFACIDPSCSDFPAYATRSEWAAHMNRAHGALLVKVQGTSDGEMQAASNPDQSITTCHICKMSKSQERNYENLKNGGILSHVADHLQTLGLLALEISKNVFSVEEKKRSSWFRGNGSEKAATDILYPGNEIIFESINGTMGDGSANEEAASEQKTTLQPLPEMRDTLLEQVLQIRRKYDRLLEKAINIHTDGIHNLPSEASAALARIECHVQQRIGESDTFHRKDLFGFFDGLLSSIAYNEDEAIVNYCTDQVWTARQHHSRERPAEGILASRRKLLSVLVIHKSPQAILKFINEGISDFHIPISGDTLRQKFPDWTESFIDSFLMIQAQLIFDPPHDVNMLTRRHNIVIAAPLHGNFSTTTTEAVVKDMLKKFPNISLSLMAVDNIDPTGIKYEGKLSACNYRGQQLKGIIPWGKFTRKLRAKYLRPKPDDFSSALNRRIQRLHLMDEVPVRVHYGPIAFSDQLIKNAVIQEHLIRDKDVYPNSKLDPSSRFSRTPALDPDSDLDPKSDLDPNSCKTWEMWQDYAAMTAATYANEILRGIPPINIVAVDESGFAAL
ncbi:hypothetical protein LI328DRAFT_166998 [Trichoderma asperelloides]|nr:hypothetical protein LI328DRAFT_166998 [Trichoderma asperelloides]